MKVYYYLNLIAKKYPNKFAFISNTKKITFLELKQQVENLAFDLKSNGIKSKQKVGILSNNSIDYIIIELACAIIDVVVVPISPSMAKKDIIKQIKFTDVKYIFLWHAIYQDLQKSLIRLNIKKKNITTIGNKIKNVSFLDELVVNNKIVKKFNLKNNDGSNPFLIILTSGSSSNPKAIVFSQKTKLLRAFSAVEIYNIKSTDKLILSTPIKQSISQRFIHLSILMGCTTVVMENFSVNLWLDLVKKYKITFSILVASQIKNISKYLKTKDSRLKTLKKLVSCCAELDNQTKNTIIRKKICSDFYDTYGATEVGTVTNINLSKLPLNRNTLGPPIKDVSIKILDKNNKEIKEKNKKGLIACKSKFTFSYYLKSDLKNKNIFNEYFKTGDIGYIDNAGMLHLTGREKEIIIVGGVNVFPEDIERVLNSNSGIKKSAVIGLKDKRLGEGILAMIVLKNQKKFNLLEIKKFCIKNLSDYQQPHKFIILKKFPLVGGYGKISKHKLKLKYKNIDLSKNIRATFT
jgi:long-chain acyl-CoA synthetase